METNRPVPNPSGTSSALSSSDDETSDNNNDEENWDFDEPHCKWRPTGQDDEDCGEGVICPPCG